MLTFFLGLIAGVLLASLAEWLLDRRHWARDRAAIARGDEAQQAALAAARAEIERLRALPAAQASAHPPANQPPPPHS